jgi:hypothetical protein
VTWVVALVGGVLIGVIWAGADELTRWGGWAVALVLVAACVAVLVLG